MHNIKVTYHVWYDNQFNNLTIMSNVKQIPRVLIKKKTIIISTIKKELLWASNK
jgi:hypothetical protein